MMKCLVSDQSVNDTPEANEIEEPNPTPVAMKRKQDHCREMYTHLSLEIGLGKVSDRLLGHRGHDTGSAVGLLRVRNERVR